MSNPEDGRIKYLVEENEILAPRVVAVGTKRDPNGVQDVTWLTFRYLNEIQSVSVARRPEATPEEVATELVRLALDRLNS